MRTYLCVYFGSAYLALLTTPLVIWLARRIGAVDYPGIRSIHTKPIPRIGGIAIYSSSVCPIVSLLFLNNNIGQQFRAVWLQVVTLLAAATAIFVVGLIDDLRRLPATVKFLVELLGAAALCVVGVHIDSVGLGGEWVLSLGWLGWPLTLLWIVGVTNAVNMSDGLDGLAGGIAAIACGVIAVFAIHGSTVHTGLAASNDIMMALFALALLGGLSGFLFFNFNPAKVFMGDCGSLFIGFTIAAASVMCVSKSAALVGLALPALALGIPIFDTLFSMLRRFLERRSLFAPDRGHFHHHLLALGLNQRRAVILIYLATLAAASLGLFMLGSDDLGSLVVFAAVSLLIVLLFQAVGAVHLRDTLARLQRKYRYSHRQREERRTFENLQLRFRQAHEGPQWWQAVCEAADRMGFAWVSLKTTHADGRVETEIWRVPSGAPADLLDVMTMTVPFRNGDPDCSYELEVGISVNGSFESASHRGTLFGRLLDESELRTRR
jgi:UDP-GlcNAc:undecaprenyl-phosphate GlcNAc-1-phosphate transferase